MTEQATVELTPTEPAIEALVTATPENESKVSVVEDKAEDTDKVSKALQRRIDRLTRDKYQLRAENDQLRAPRPENDDPDMNEEVQTRAQVLAHEIAERKEFNKRCDDVYEKGKKASKNFDDAFKNFSEEIGGAFDAKGNPSTVMSAILDADEPHKLVIYLNDNPDLSSELADLSPARQIRRIAQIEKEMGEKKTIEPSKAPKPAQPVKGGAGESEPDPKDTKRWIEWENSKLLAQRARK